MPTIRKLPCIIPARGGSKGLARKNILSLAGKPLIAWAIEAAKAAESVDRIYVSTEDVEIATVATKFGAEVLNRPNELGGDETSSEAVLIDALKQLDGFCCGIPEAFLFVQCTSPMILPEDINGAVDLFKRENADSVISATPGHWYMWKIAKNGQAEPINHSIEYRPRRQERGLEFRENGMLYVLRTTSFLEAGMRYCGKILLYETPMGRSFEVDDDEDFALLESLMRNKWKTHPE